MTFLPGYDHWKTGGDPHTSIDRVVCPNPECPMFGDIQTREVFVQYGKADAVECHVCGEVMELEYNFDADVVLAEHELDKAVRESDYA